MKFAFYDPALGGNEYATFFLVALRRFAMDNGIDCAVCGSLDQVRDSCVVLFTGHLSETLIDILKNNRNKIIGFNVSDTSHISAVIRYAKNLPLVDLIFMLSGVALENRGNELIVDEEFNLKVIDVPFFPDEDWMVFDYLRKSGRLKPLPYVPWNPIPDGTREPYGRRSQKVILRGGGHSRRFILALFLMLKDKLDANSGFFLRDYFADDMNPQFRYCGECRDEFKKKLHYPYQPPLDPSPCNSPAKGNGFWSLETLGLWNNRCPRSFYWMTERFMARHGQVDMNRIEAMLNANWMYPKDHSQLLGRITFASDLKWVHSVYQPQRFWEAAAAGCINVMPKRILHQDYFPPVNPGEHYLLFNEDMQHLDLDFSIDEARYNEVAGAMRSVYQTWIPPTIYPINSNLLNYILDEIKKL